MSIFAARFRGINILLLILVASHISLIVPLQAQRNLSGTPEIELALRKLNVLGSVLMIAAHPDDENTALLAYFARGRSLRTGYLSITRGEGGQNLIGPQQGDLLGVIRTQELLAARRIDGAEQYFTRAIDFGYSKTADETLAKWGHEQILSDIVWVIRKFQPDVVVLRFSGTSRDGHGHHQSSAILGREAFVAAADKQRFPEQLQYVQPWQAKRLFWNAFSFTPEQEKEARALTHLVEVDTGEFNPILGKSYAEIAGISRSQHRSQGFGAPERRGPSRNYLTTIAGPPAGHDPLDDVDTTWGRVAGGEAIGRILEEAERSFVPEQPEKTIPLLLKARPLIAAIQDPWAKRKLEQLDETLVLCAGLWLDATADRYTAVPGSTLKIELEAINRSHYLVKKTGFGLSGPDGDRGGGLYDAQPMAYNQLVRQELIWPIPPGTPYSQPYWLRNPPTGNAYDIRDQELIGMAVTPPEFLASFAFDFGGTEITLKRPVHYRYVDPTEGELTRGVVIVPEVAVSLPEAVQLFPSKSSKTIEVQLKANTADMAGDVRVETPPGWGAEPASQPFRLLRAGDEQTLTVAITPPVVEGQGRLRAVAHVDGKEISSGVAVLVFPHIPPQTLIPEAAAKVQRADVKIAAHKVGYVMGAGDQMPEALRQLGCDVTLLSANELAESSLSAFDAVVTGVRAYNVRPDLRANQQRLLDYVRDGGTLIVQYNVAEGGPFGGRSTGELERIGPFPIKIGRARVSVEEAPVRFVNPDSPLLVRPNRITGRDFEGWIQERGLYFASEWDTRYQPVVETQDPGEKPLEGGLLYAPYGKGMYIFTTFSWFRQLPAGVPGAYRIFANLLSARGSH
jgi:LmbE family N-acetylglucosaminyl deacetylase